MSSIRVAQLAMGYEELTHSDANCSTCSRAVAGDRPARFRCQEGGFYVGSRGTCKKHVPNKTPAGTAIVNCGACSATRGCLIDCAGVRATYALSQIGPTDI